MERGKRIGRRNNIPILYTRGNHYEVGFDIGRTFRELIQNFLAINSDLNESLVPMYKTDAGRKVYDDSLAVVTKNFPQYVREMEGTAVGANVPFHKEILGHNEDALTEVLGHYYLVSAHIISESPQGRWNVKEEHFTSFCYAGYLPGCTMGYNHHGLVFSVNAVGPEKLESGKTPCTFLLRSLLAAENFAQAQQMMRDKGYGAGEGMSVNMTFLNQEGDRLFHNAEVAPAVDGADESELCIFTASPGENLMHCNKYLRLQVPQFAEGMISSNHRHATMETFPKPSNRKDVINILGDKSDKEYSIFRETNVVQTVAVGIFDCIGKTWSLYADNPKTNDPIVVLPLILKPCVK